jgi:hypothetical protein
LNRRCANRCPGDHRQENRVTRLHTLPPRVALRPEKSNSEKVKMPRLGEHQALSNQATLDFKVGH